MSVNISKQKNIKNFYNEKNIDVYDKKYINKKLEESEKSDKISLKKAYLEGWK